MAGSPSNGMPTVGELAPDFEAPTAAGRPLRLSSLRGSSVVLYFYPEADTPSCTRESKGLRDLYPELQSKGVEVVGVSVDDVAKQSAFCEKYGLPFPLVADATKKVATTYAVLRPSGRARRATFLIGPDGKIVEVVDVPEADRHV